MRVMAYAKSPDGKDVNIMSVEQWNTYCFEFNKLNGLEQPEKLIKDMEYYAQENRRRR